MNIFWILKPHVGIGPVTIGSRWADICENLEVRFEQLSADESIFDAEYEDIHENISVSVSQGVVRSVGASTECFYGGVNLIGLNVISLEKVLQEEATSVDEGIEHESGDLQVFRNYDKLRLIVSLINGVVDSIDCFE